MDLMDARELREKFLEFFRSKGHTIIPSASLIPPETDPTALFTTAGMHPLVPYLLGEDHPGGKRVANIQKCIRTVDINEVGDNRHLTFFEMMGNWSFGDYFKKEAIEWSFEFLTDKKNGLGLDLKRLFITVFRGEDGIPRDEESIVIWQDVFAKAGISNGVASEDGIIKDDVRIIPLGTDDNFWIASSIGPCGPDTEIFYDTRPGEGKLEGKFSELVGSFRLIEVWNDVFMEFNRDIDGKYRKLAQKNVDTGMGVERTLAVIKGKETVFDTELFQPIFEKISEISGKKYEENEQTKKSFRIIADHVKAGVFIIADRVTPSNVGQGYVLRRLIRRAIRHGKLLDIGNNFTKIIAEVVIDIYIDQYPEVEKNKENIFEELDKEENKFTQALKKGLREYKMQAETGKFKLIGGEVVFNLYQTYGFPFEMTKELAEEAGLEVDEVGFNEELKKHQELSQTASAGRFKGGLTEAGEQTAKLHTATHLLHAALRKILGPHVEQRGSNITAERLRFDFSHPEKLALEQIGKVEDLVNEKIRENLPVTMEEMSVEEAKKIGAIGIFESKYGKKIKVYSVESAKGEPPFSREICGGPHAQSTGELGHFRITKEEASSAGVRRIKAVLE